MKYFDVAFKVALLLALYWVGLKIDSIPNCNDEISEVARRVATIGYDIEETNKTLSGIEGFLSLVEDMQDEENKALESIASEIVLLRRSNR